MKKLALLLVMGLVALSSFGGNNPELSEEISEGMNIDLSTVELNEYEEDFVEVTFRVINGQIKIQGLKATQYELKRLVVKKLITMRIKSDYEAGKIYRCRFTFEKV